MKTLFLYLFVFVSILHNQTIIEQNQKTLSFFMNQLLPSLFILCVFVQLLPTPNIKTKRNISLFNVDISTLFLILKMILLGNPGNSYLINDLVKKDILTISQAKRLISCVSIPSISFMLMTIPYLYTNELAYILFIIHILSIFILLFMTRKTEISLNLVIENKTLIDALLFTIKTMAIILSYLFVISSVQSILLIYLPQFEFYIYLLLEFSSGTSYLINHSNALFYLLICIGFGGFCSHLQIVSGCDENKFNYFKYLGFRIIHVVFNLILYGLCLYLWKYTIL